MKYVLLMIAFSVSAYGSNECITYKKAQTALMEMVDSHDFKSRYEADSFRMIDLFSSLTFSEDGYYFARANFDVEVDCWSSEECSTHPAYGTLLVKVSCEGNSQFNFSYDHD